MPGWWSDHEHVLSVLTTYNKQTRSRKSRGLGRIQHGSMVVDQEGNVKKQTREEKKSGDAGSQKGLAANEKPEKQSCTSDL